MSARRELIEAAQALAKVRTPELEHYQALLTAIATVWTYDTGVEVDCLIRRKEPLAARMTLAWQASQPLDAMSDEQRMEIFERYCIHCGRKQPEGRKCQCWNDE